MANIPTPKSYNQILGSMIAAFQAKHPIQNFKVGGPLLTILEAAAQSDFRATSETFALLAATTLASASGTALDRIAVDEGSFRLGASPASGVVTIGDSRYTKIASTLSLGSPAPNIGAASIVVSNGNDFPASGEVFIGRGTSNYECPIPYTSKTLLYGTAYQLNFPGGTFTQKFHNQSESVVLAQGGDRVVPAGTICQTPQGGTAEASTYSVLYPVTLLNGEVSLEGVKVVCTVPGTIGNVPIGTINSWQAAPFTGATVINPGPFTNGVEAESDDQLRDRIRNLRQSRTRGTPLAIETFLNGVIANDEDKRIISSRVLQRQGEPATVYIDDGTGYEEVRQGIASEMLVESAIGGETYFQLIEGRPVAKAFLKSSVQSPYILEDGATLNIFVGGFEYIHTFTSGDFRSLNNATAWEVAHSINANSTLAFSATTADGGTNVVLTAKSDTNDSIEYVGGTAGSVFQFGLGEQVTARIYKNGKLLSKDGRPARLVSNAQSSWSSYSSYTLDILVDGVLVNVTIVDADFVQAGTSYNTISVANDLASWADVLNFKIPGITASVVGDRLVLTSNLGSDARGSLEITGGTLATNVGMFAVGSDTAVINDYTLNRNTGQLKLTTPLNVGDRLEVGSFSTAAFVESVPFSSIPWVNSSSMFYVVDGAASIVETEVSGATLLRVNSVTVDGVAFMTLRAVGNTTCFANVQPGDTVVFNDTYFYGDGGVTAWRVSDNKVSGGDNILYFDSGLVPYTTGVDFNLADSDGLVVVRSAKPVHRVDIAVPPSGLYTPTSLALAFNTQMAGLYRNLIATVNRTLYLNIRTTTEAPDGDLMIVAVNNDMRQLGLTTKTLIRNQTAQVGIAVSGKSELAFPSKYHNTIVAGGTLPTLNESSGNSNVIVVGLPNSYDWSTEKGYGTVQGYVASLFSASGTTISPRRPLFNPLQLWVAGGPGGNTLYEALGHSFAKDDTMTVVVDNDNIAKRFDLPFSRRVTSTGAYAATSVVLKDFGGTGFLASTFGINFDFNDWALWMRARQLDSSILWRSATPGPMGNGIGIRYQLPIAPNATPTLAVSLGASPPGYEVTIPSGGARAPLFATGMRMGWSSDGNNVRLHTGHRITRLQRAVDGQTVTATLDTADGNNTLPIGASVYIYLPGPTGGFVSPTSGGQFTITNSAAGSIQYLEVGTASEDSGVGIWGTVSWATSVVAINDITIGDVIAIDTAETTFPAALTGKPLRTVSSGLDDTAVLVSMENPLPATAGIVWGSSPLLDIANVQAFPVGGPSTDIVTAINALTDAPLTALDVGAPTTISQATWEGGPGGFTLTDGINYVSITYNPPNTTTDFTVDLKNPVDATLAASTTWVTEDLWLVPTKNANLVDYWSLPSITALAENADILEDSDGHLQILSNTLGALGAVRVTGGTANASFADIRGSIAGTTAEPYVYVPAVEVAGLLGCDGSYVKITNDTPIVKANAGIAGALVSINSGTRTFTMVDDVWTGSNNSGNITFTRVGAFMRVHTSDFSWNVLTGDWVEFSNGVSSGNIGRFRIVHSNGGDAITIDNPNGVNESVAATNVITYRSRDVVPGDKLTISTTAWGAGNRRTFTVQGVASATSFVVEETPDTQGASAATQTSLVDSTTLSVYLRPLYVLNHPTDSTLKVVRFEDVSGSRVMSIISDSYNSRIEVMGKLGFDTSSVFGVDGYHKSIGLIGEANRVLYGDANDPSTYPGVVAAGANVNISGPVVRRVTLSLALRLRTGATRQQVFDGVRNAITTYINTLDVGESVALSKAVSLASAVGGVSAVTVVSPTYGIGSDLIAVQPYEKAMVLSPDTDISLSIVG